MPLSKGKALKNMLEDSGNSLLYLPPYSPDINPIEKKGPKPNIEEEH
ncbi:hypothetical protein HE1_00028 [Holospora elegans E1]|uniref:Tc1-like transposase DDE domain-containing protein n=1 Tax=Holospora elegans E1 TaxID=1427503 RepID=A0A023DWK9_9PROT|nr:transposase [Holospora elegans]GAJ45719.1 hypothetical protein HE1_00028 [Holospora elegans E1]